MKKKTKTAREFLITKQASTGVAPVLCGNKACSQQDCSVFGQEGKGPSAQAQCNSCSDLCFQMNTSLKKQSCVLGSRKEIPNTC